MTLIFELSDKDFRAAVIKMFQRVIANTLETDEKSGRTWQRNRGYKKEPAHKSMKLEHSLTRYLKINALNTKKIPRIKQR